MRFDVSFATPAAFSSLARSVILICFSVARLSALGNHRPCTHFMPFLSRSSNALPVCGISHGGQLPLVTVGETLHIGCRGILKVLRRPAMLSKLSLRILCCDVLWCKRSFLHHAIRKYEN